MLTVSKQSRLHGLRSDMQSEWTGDGGISKDLLYGELVQGKCPTGRPHLPYKDVCMRDLKVMGN